MTVLEKTGVFFQKKKKKRKRMKRKGRGRRRWKRRRSSLWANGCLRVPEPM